MARVILALKLVQPLKDRYDWSGAGTAPVVTELTRITCGSVEGQLLCWAASSAAEEITVTPWRFAQATLARQRGVVERPECLLDDVHPVVGRVQGRLGEA